MAIAHERFAHLTDEQRARLMGFALDVLLILERDEDWGGGTLDDIGADAAFHELRDLDEHGQFRVAAPYREDV